MGVGPPVRAGPALISETKIKKRCQHGVGWLEERQLPRKEENEKSHKCEWSQGERNFLLLCRKEGFMRQVSKTERENSFFFFPILFLTAPCLHCCARVFSSYGERGTTLCCSAGGSHPCGFPCYGAQAPATKTLIAPALWAQ